MFAAWANAKTGVPVRKWKTKGGRPPPFVCTLPPGPLKAAYLSVAEITAYEDSKLDSAHQKVVFETDEEMYDTEMFARYKKAMDHLTKFFNEDRLRFLADNIDKHDMLSEAEREIGQESIDALYKQLLLANNTRGNNTHHKCNVAAAKRKIFRDGERRQGKFVPGICEPDKKTLELLEDANGDVQSYLEREDGAKRLNLYNIILPDATPLLPSEYSCFKPRGAIASLEVTCYGVYCRMEGGEPQQHTVMLGATRLHVLSNGRDGQSASTTFDVDAVLNEASSRPEPVVDMDEEALVPNKPKRKAGQEKGSKTKKSKIVFE